MEQSPGLDVVTGGLSYIGKYITRRILSDGRKVQILTGHLDRPNPFGDQVSITPFNFDSQREIVASLHGATTLYNTYWVRFDYGPVSFDQAIKNTKNLIEAAREAEVRKFVHISVSNPSGESPFPYYRGKAVIEKMIEQSGIPYAIIRPTLVFGGEEEILVNNIAWLLRRFPVFAIPGAGDYQLQPIHVDEVADIAVHASEAVQNKTIDAAGPDILTFDQMIRLIAQKIHSRALIFHLNAPMSMLLLKLVEMIVSDVVLTPDELGALMKNLLISKDPPAGRIRLGEWLDVKANQLGRTYASELDRHYR